MRYLVVGLGNIGKKRVQLLGPRCIATADPFNTAASFVDPSAVDPGTYDAAVLAVPNDTKLGLLEYFLDRGKHVLIEKPLLLPDKDQAERLQALAEARHAIWYTSYNHRFEPLVESLKQELEAHRIGDLYHGRLFYGNGTVANISGTWRDRGLGVLEDLGSHLLDLSAYLFEPRPFVSWTLDRHEAATYDHCLLASADGTLVLEASFLSWKNTFTIDLFGSRGSMHVHGLPKWGPAQLIVRERVLPSGIPRETVQTAEPWTDVTWQRDLDHFEHLTTLGQTSYANDLWISQTLLGLVPE